MKNKINMSVTEEKENMQTIMDVNENTLPNQPDEIDIASIGEHTAYQNKINFTGENSIIDVQSRGSFGERIDSLNA